MIEINGVSKIYPGASTRALDDVSLSVGRGEVFGIVGQSGAGKSTLIRCVNMLERPTSGTITLDGTDVTALGHTGLRTLRHRIGMIFQHFNLLSSRTALGNVEFALEITKVPRAKRRARAMEMLELVGLADRAGLYPAQLSGGQKQRVGIARALAREPSVLLSDEATSALDPETTEQVLELVKTINDELGLTILLITHEMDVVKRICHSTAQISDGRITEAGRVIDLVQTPGSHIGRALFRSVESREFPTAGSILDITFLGPNANEPVLSRLSRSYDVDIAVLGAQIDTFSAGRVGRLTVHVPATGTGIDPLIDDLSGHGFVVDRIHEGVSNHG